MRLSEQYLENNIGLTDHTAPMPFRCRLVGRYSVEDGKLIAAVEEERSRCGSALAVSPEAIVIVCMRQAFRFDVGTRWC
jgi:hypothetical protein